MYKSNVDWSNGNKNIIHRQKPIILLSFKPIDEANIYGSPMQIEPFYKFIRRCIIVSSGMKQTWATFYTNCNVPLLA